MTTLHYIILSGVLISLISISGVALIKSSKRLAGYIERNLMPLSALSAGVFLVTSFILIRETLEILPLTSAIFSFAIGAVTYVVLHNVFKHHRHGAHHDHGHDHKHAAWKVLIGDTIHNIADGMLLVTSFAFGNPVGFSTTLSIMMHEVPQEVSEFLVLKRAGYSTREATYRNIATATSIFVGIAIAIALINTEAIQAYLLGATAAFFLGIVFTDLFPVRKVFTEKKSLQMVSALVLGILVMSAITTSLGHSHTHTSEDGSEHFHEEVNDHHEDHHGEALLEEVHGH